MNKQDFIQLIKDPSRISPEQLQELEKVVAGFPYCQSAYILIAKQAADTGSMLADQKLKKAAAYTLDRKNLKRLLSGKKEIPLADISKIAQKELSPKEEIPVIVEEKILTENLVKETPKEEINAVVEEEKIIPADISKELPKQESIVTEEIKNSTTTREALTDEKRDQIIKELQENLKKLHTIKIKTAWDEVPEELTLSETIKKEEPKETETVVIQDTSNSEQTEKTESSTSGENIISTVENSETENNFTIQETISSSIEDESLEDFLDKEVRTYPIRTEDVVVEIKETEADTGLLLEYLDFLEEKRSIFRKNKKKEDAIIDKIIKEDPTIPKLDINNLPDNSVDLSSKSSTISKGPISENFAKILGLQGKKDKAIEIYEQLILKNPEKKPYFEAQIEKLKNKI